MNRTKILAILARAVAEANGRPIVLNTYCCQGGSAAGYEAAGFYVLGVDIADQPRYPYLFVQADVLESLAEYAEWIREHVTLVDASPPCQRYSRAQKIQQREHPDLIAPTRELLLALGLPFVIENVEEAAPELRSPVMLCGAMFPGLHTYRHRLLETSFPVVAPVHPRHVHPTVKMGRPLREGDWYHAVGNFSNVPYVRSDMGVEWMSRDGIRECIPPRYTQFVAVQFLAQQQIAVAA
ncbi:SAM-dependent methyltransferase [Streptomyces sp. NPDC056227]|uniref:SAM-dependent methyltransferase n=1 Tax=Streptomyces sp. NPDC056227 TaxID=3345753 RepID=UPI0035DEE676